MYQFASFPFTLLTCCKDLNLLFPHSTFVSQSVPFLSVPSPQLFDCSHGLIPQRLSEGRIEQTRTLNLRKVLYPLVFWVSTQGRKLENVSDMKQIKCSSRVIKGFPSGCISFFLVRRFNPEKYKLGSQANK